MLQNVFVLQNKVLLSKNVSILKLIWNSIKLEALSQLVLYRFRTGRNIKVSKIGFKVYVPLKAIIII